MNVLLVSTYELGRQPFGIASPAAWLLAEGHQVRTADLSIEKLQNEAILWADLVGFYLPMHTATRLAEPVIQRVCRTNPKAKTAAFGLYAPLNSSYLKTLGVDVVIGGEFEAELAALARHPDAPAIREVSLDRLMFLQPARRLLPELQQYPGLKSQNEAKVVGYTEASRGCRHRCRHCPVVPVYKGIFRIVSADVVLADIRQQVLAGAGHVTFGDPDFFNGPGHARRILELLSEEFPSLTYDVTIKVEHLLKYRDKLPLLARTGCLWVTTAVESTEDQVLEKLDKGHTRADFLEAVRLTRGFGLHLSPTFVPFTPWTTLSGYRDLLRLLLELDLVDAVPPVQLALRLLIPNQSLILQMEDRQDWLGSFDPAALLYRWSHPDPNIDRVAAEVMAAARDAGRENLTRREAFARIWQIANGGSLPENLDLAARTTIPYLEEPWYC